MNQGTRVVTPTDSYSLQLPEGVVEQYEDRTASFWKPDESTLLQVSSYIRLEGPQVPAAIRLDELLSRERVRVITRNVSAKVDCPDWAAALAKDDEGVNWFYGYAVWPDLCIMVSVSGSPHELASAGTWAFDALRTLHRRRGGGGTTG